MGTELRVAIVDRQVGETWYSSALADALSRYCNVRYYGDNSIGNVEKVWDPYLFFLQIPYRCIKDKIDVVQLNFEVGVFGNFYTNLLLPLLLFFLKISGRKIVTIVHAVTPKKFFDEKNEYVYPQGYPKNPRLLKFGMLCAFYVLNMFSNKLVVHSQVFKEWFNEYVKTDKIVVIPHGVIDSDYDYTNDVRRYLDCQFSTSIRDKKKILCFGVISPRKGLEILIRALSKVKGDAILLIAGKEMPYFSGYLTDLKDMVIDLKEDRVHFLGQVSDQIIHILYELADIVVLPYTISVSASGALAFAMQHGRPTILSETEFFMDEITEREGVFFPINDEQRLRDCIEKLLSDRQLREDIGSKLKLKGRQRSWDSIAKMLMEEYV